MLRKYLCQVQERMRSALPCTMRTSWQRFLPWKRRSRREKVKIFTSDAFREIYGIEYVCAIIFVSGTKCLSHKRRGRCVTGPAVERLPTAPARELWSCAGRAFPPSQSFRESFDDFRCEPVSFPALPVVPGERRLASKKDIFTNKNIKAFGSYSPKKKDRNEKNTSQKILPKHKKKQKLKIIFLVSFDERVSQFLDFFILLVFSDWGKKK